MQKIINRLRRNSVSQNEAPKKRSRSTGLMMGLAVTTLSVLAFGLSPVLASALPAVQLGNQATLVAQGSAITLPVTVTCDSGTSILALSTLVTQRSGKRIAQGSTAHPTATIVCDSVPHVVNVNIHAQIPNQVAVPFKKGPAAASANFVFCEPQPSFICRGITDFKEITIVKPNN